MEKINECKMLGMMGDDGFEKIRRVYATDALVPAISTKEDRIKILEDPEVKKTQYRIRKLTPKECWRLMGYTDEDYEKAAAVNSNTQLYKQAGNAIVKQVLMAIFRQMIPENYRKKV